MKANLMKRTVSSRIAKMGAVVGVAMVMAVSATSAASANGTHQQITGSGSSWAAGAVNQWVADVQQNGLQVVFTSNGSASGRRDFADQTSDFAVSDIGYQGVDPDTGASDTACQDPNVTSTCLDYKYVPIVAGGTSFPYQIKEGGQLVRNLRLSGETLAKIFTNTLGTPGSATYMNWDNPEITADNNGRHLPALPIIPVVHEEGSGSSAQFTQYMATMYPNIWKPYNNGKDVEDEYYPQKAPEVAQNGSDGMIDFITSTAGDGAIGYDEYTYALGKNYPVVQLENKAGYFTSPTQYNVAVALTKAQINMNPKSADYLLQDLSGVYVNPDPRAYAMSSYSYAIIPTGPTSNDARMNTAKRQTIADFLYYSVCQGQGQIGPIGYSALPVNLVQAAFAQIGLLHTADSAVNLNKENVSTCHNPTFIAGHPTENYLAKIAPQPLACQKVGEGPCGIAPASEATPTPTPSSGSGKSGKDPKGGGSNPSSSPGASQSPGAQTTGPAVTLPTSQAVIPGGGPPGTGEVGPTVAAAADGSGDAGTGTLIGDPTTVADSSNGGIGDVLGILAGVLLVVLIALPSYVSTRLRKRKSTP
jgi:phosphate transport system substrate-binding protein